MTSPLNPTQERTATEYTGVLTRVIEKVDNPDDSSSDLTWPAPEFWENVRKMTPAGRRLLVEKLNARLEEIRREEALARQAEAVVAKSIRMAAENLDN